MIETLRPALTGSMAFCADTLVGPEDPRPAIVGGDLLEPATIDAILDTFAASFPDGDRRAVASYWAQGYFRRLIPPVAAVLLLIDRNLPIAVFETAVLRGREGEVVAFRLTNDGEPVADPEVVVRFERLIRQNIEPFIKAWTSHTRVAPRLYWNFAGVYLDWALGEIAAHPLAGALAADASRLLSSRDRLDGTPNPLFEPFETVQRRGEPHRQRRLCCIRYRLPGIPFCETCPHPKAPGNNA